mgnify:CR=1 FL=1
MAARTAPARTAAQHQPLLASAAASIASDGIMTLAKVREMVPLRSEERTG